MMLHQKKVDSEVQPQVQKITVRTNKLMRMGTTANDKDYKIGGLKSNLITNTSVERHRKEKRMQTVPIRERNTSPDIPKKKNTKDFILKQGSASKPQNIPIINKRSDLVLRKSTDTNKNTLKSAILTANGKKNQVAPQVSEIGDNTSPSDNNYSLRKISNMKSLTYNYEQPTTSEKFIKRRRYKKNSDNENDRIMAPSYMVYYFTVAQGNNHEMIERILSNRQWWKKYVPMTPGNLALGPQQHIQFSWKMNVDQIYSITNPPLTQPSGGYLQKNITNRFSHSGEISDKDNFFRNMWFYCKRKELDIFDTVPLTFSFRMNEYQFEKDLQNFCRLFLSNQQKCSIDDIKPIRSVWDQNLNENVDIYFDMKICYLQRLWGGRKFENIDSKAVLKLPEYFHKKNLWIIKPSGCDRGKGVEIFKTLDELSKFLYLYSSGYNMSEYKNMNYNDLDEISPALKEGAMEFKSKKRIFSKFVIQKYMEKPALYKGYKFDIRVHALYTKDSCLYIFRDSYVRLCSLPYDIDKTNYFAHLCNTSVNVKSDNYGKIADGNAISVGELSQFFAEKEAKNPNNSIKDFEVYFYEKMKDLVKKAFDSMHSINKKINLMNPFSIPNTFELFGLDVMVDENYRCWLIEANYIPGLTDDGSAYAKRYFDRMIDDMFKITIDEEFPLPRNATRKERYYPLLDFPNEENLWKLICKYETE